MWFVFRSFGAEKLQDFIRDQCQLAKYFESLLREDGRFRITNDVKVSLVTFLKYKI